MKTALKLIFCLFLLGACSNNKKEVEALKTAHQQDSIALVNSKGKDSIITSYVNAMGEIQDDLDSLKIKEHILTMNASEGNKPGQKAAIKESIKSIDSAIILSNRKIFQLESRIKKMEHKDAGLNKMIARLTDEITEKNKEIAELQSKLSASGDSMSTLSRRFNDSIAEITKQRQQLNSLTAQLNTAYYIVGTLKQLKEKGAVDTKGGLLGIARTAELKSNASIASFTKVDLTQLQTIPLNGKFSKILTSHPSGSYNIGKKGKSDVLIISDPNTFWSESKYLVVQIR